MNYNPYDSPLQKAAVEAIQKALPDVPVFTSSGEPTNERDTHFANFAKLVMEEIGNTPIDDSFMGYAIADWQEVAETVIARRAFDLAVHVIHMHTAIEQPGTVMTPGEVIRKMPDLDAEFLPPLDFPEPQS